jgi:hypothetical protein
MNLADLTGRVQRLDQLMRGLAREVALWKEGTDPLLHQERRAYLKGIQDALAGVETARAALAQARQRLQQEQDRPQSSRPSRTKD